MTQTLSRGEMPVAGTNTMPPIPQMRAVFEDELLIESPLAAATDTAAKEPDVQEQIAALSKEMHDYVLAPDFSVNRYSEMGSRLRELQGRIAPQGERQERTVTAPIVTDKSEISDSPNSREYLQRVFDAIVADGRLSTEEKLAAVEQAKNLLINEARKELRIANARAGHIEHEANEQSRILREDAKQQNAQKTAETNVRADQARAKGKREADEHTAEAEAEISTVLAERKLLDDPTPKVWPAELKSRILNFDCDQRRANAAIEAEGLRQGGEDIAARLIKQTARDNRHILTEAIRKAEAVVAQEGEHANRIRQEARDRFTRLERKILEQVAEAVNEIRRQEVARRRKEEDPSIATLTVNDTTRRLKSIPIDVESIRTAASGTTRKDTQPKQQTAPAFDADIPSVSVPVWGAKTTEEVPTVRPQAHVSYLRRHRLPSALAGGVLTAIMIVGGVEIASSNKGNSDHTVTADQLAERAAQLPKWAPPSIEAWNKTITDAVQSSIATHGNTDYLIGGHNLGAGMERTMDAAIMLSSAGDPDPSYAPGLYGVGADALNAEAKQAGVAFDPSKPDFKVESELVGRMINDAVAKVMADPKQKASVEAAYKKNKDLTALYQAAAGSLGLSDDFKPYFVDLCNEWDQPSSNALDKLLSDPSWKDAYATAEKHLQANGMLPAKVSK